LNEKGFILESKKDYLQNQLKLKYLLHAYHVPPKETDISYFEKVMHVEVDNLRRELEDQHQTHIHGDDDQHNCSSHSGKCKELHILKHNKEGKIRAEIYNEFIEEALSKNKPILVVGQDGISNSAALVISYLMWKKKLTFEEAFQFVYKKRPIIKLPSFMKRDLEKYAIRLESKSITERIIPNRKTKK